VKDILQKSTYLSGVEADNEIPFTTKKEKKDLRVTRHPHSNNTEKKAILKQGGQASKNIPFFYHYENARELSPAILNVPVGSATLAHSRQNILQDTFTTGALAGLIGTVVMHIFSLLWRALGFIDITTMQVSGGNIFKPPAHELMMTRIVLNI